MTASSRRNSVWLWLALALATVTALLPWWRHRHYLRDLFDYGIVIAANGRLDAGDRPYVDFTTPIQAGFLGLNWLVERAGGGTYLALTWGGAALIAATTVLLGLMLARRWPAWAAAGVAWAVAASAAAQHTILWHNALGVFCLALVSWSAAVAPVLRRADAGWHLLAAAGLFLGGINKLNFHLVALAVALAWALRAGCTRRAGAGRVIATAGAILLAGGALPLAAELAWTGASPQLWYANVVALAAGSRADLLGAIFSVNFLLRPLHDYYGLLILPQVGLVGLLLSVVTFIGCRPAAAPGNRDRWLLPLAVVLAGVAGAALIVTNFDIACLGLGAWLVLVVSIWLGFGPPPRRFWFGAGLVLPTLLLGAAAWWTAWLGLRSQFGFSDAPRSSYVDASVAGPEFAPLRGLLLPPDLMQSLEVLDHTLPEGKFGAPRPVFFGPGLEFVDRFYPSRKWERQPLWAHYYTSYGPVEIARLAAELAGDEEYRAVYLTEAFDEWPPEVRQVLQRYYIKDIVGPRVRCWTRRDDDAVDLADSFAALTALGGNVEGAAYLFDRHPLRFKRLADGRTLLGTRREHGSVTLRVPTYRVHGVAVLDRQDVDPARPVRAYFKVIIHGGIPENVRWEQHVELPPGQQSISVPFEADAANRQLEMWVIRRDGVDGAFGGFRELAITHAAPNPFGPPALRPVQLPESPADPALGASLFGDIAWRPQRLVVRGGSPHEAGLALVPGGELWLHSTDLLGEIRGTISRPSGPVFARVVWYKGGRIQVLQNTWVMPGQPFAFHAWTAEPGGWIGIQLHADNGPSPALVRINHSTLVP